MNATGPVFRTSHDVTVPLPVRFKKGMIVSTLSNDRRVVWLLTGFLAGLAVASFWPSETVHAVATDRADRFAITTVEVGPASPEAVFVLDFLTGRLTGGLLNQQSGVFTNFYFRNIAADFAVDQNAKPKYAMMAGQANLTSGRGITTATGVLYIGELNSGKLAAYRFPYRISRTPLPEPLPLELFAFFPFREPEPSE